MKFLSLTVHQHRWHQHSRTVVTLCKETTAVRWALNHDVGEKTHKIRQHHFHHPAAAGAGAGAAVVRQRGVRGILHPGSECHSTLAGRVGKRVSSGWIAAWRRRQQTQQHWALSKSRHCGEAPFAPLLSFAGSRQRSRYVSGRSLARSAVSAALHSAERRTTWPPGYATGAHALAGCLPDRRRTAAGSLALPHSHAPPPCYQNMHLSVDVHTVHRWYGFSWWSSDQIPTGSYCYQW